MQSAYRCEARARAEAKAFPAPGIAGRALVHAACDKAWQWVQARGGWGAFTHLPASQVLQHQRAGQGGAWGVPQGCGHLRHARVHHEDGLFGMIFDDVVGHTQRGHLAVRQLLHAHTRAHTHTSAWAGACGRTHVCSSVWAWGG